MTNKKNVDCGKLEKEKKSGGQEKMYSEQELQSELEIRVNEALKKARDGWDKENALKIQSERDDAARMATMSADERARAEMEKRQKAFDLERNQYLSEKMEFEAARELSKQKLPLSFAKLLSGGDIDTTISNIESFKEEFLKAVEEALSERLKGKTPATGLPAAEITDPFLSGFGR